MSFLSWTLALSLLLIMVLKGTEFHRALVCRQEAWQMGLHLLSRSLFQGAPEREQAFHSACRLSLVRTHRQVRWQKVPTLKTHAFELGLIGTL